MPEHHQVKTTKQDRPHINKIKHLAEKYNPEYMVDEAEINKPKSSWGKPQKMQSRPFDKRYRKKMSGEVERVEQD